MLPPQVMHSMHGGCAGLAVSSPFAQQQCPPVSLGSASPPASCSSAGTVLGAPMGSSAAQSSSPAATSNSTGTEAEYSLPIAPQHQQQGVSNLMAGAKRSTATYCASKEWLYRLVTFPSYFTPCISCCGSSRTPKREQLMTQFDTEYPYRVYCSNCPECKDRINSGALLQVRRSAFKDVVKATDIQRYGADVAGVQQYTLNGSKVIYLNREQQPEKKGNNTNAAPAACSVDGRAMMDKSSTYCSLKCKMTAEDPGFTAWLDAQDPSVRILAQAAANAPPKPTPASKRVQPTSSGSSGGSGACSPAHAGSGISSTSRPKKVPRTSSGVSSDAAAAATTFAARAPAMQQQQQRPLQRASSAAPVPPPAGLKRIRISLPGKRQMSAPNGFLESSALSQEPQLQLTGAPSGTSAPLAPPAGRTAAAAASNSSWLDLEHALSSTGGWGNWDSLGDSLDSPTAFGGNFGDQLGGDLWAEDDDADGSMSPALITAPSAFRSGSCDDWWLCGSPLEGGFTSAGMGALVNSPHLLP